jgi:hypothetical protein
MKINNKQLTVLLAAIILLSLSELFPPWLYEDGWTSEKHSAGYHFFNSMPDQKPISELRDVFTLPDNGPPRDISIRRALPRIYGQRLILLSLAIGLFLLLSNRRTMPKLALGGFSLVVGFAVLGLFIWYISWPRWY